MAICNGGREPRTNAVAGDSSNGIRFVRYFKVADRLNASLKNRLGNNFWVSSVRHWPGSYSDTSRSSRPGFDVTPY
jgi:hypothetical protein